MENTSMNPSFDVGIIGAGPAGSVTAAYLSRAGLRCLLLEKETFPRPHVGESLVPSVNRIFADFDLFDALEEAKFPHKYGAVWTTSEKAPSYQTDWEGLVEEKDHIAGVRFEERSQCGVDQPYTYHVDRGKFDRILLEKATSLGATAKMGARVMNVDFDSQPDPVISYRTTGGDHQAQVKMVVDASGRDTFIGNRKKWKIMDQTFNQVAIHTWFDDYDRTILADKPEQTDYIFIHFLPIQNTWVWAIPITDTITSIGVVSQKETFKTHTGTREEFFWEALRSRPEFYDAIKASRQVRPLSMEGDYSYAMQQITDDRLVLVGDAARFVDPIFSSGVSIALTSAQLASENIIRGFQKGDLSKAAFSQFEETIRHGTKNWYTFISLYYRLNVLFTYFLRDKRYRLDVLKLLQGDIYDEKEPEVLIKMREKVEEVEANPNHPWHSFLGTMTCEAFAPSF